MIFFRKPVPPASSPGHAFSGSCSSRGAAAAVLPRPERIFKRNRPGTDSVSTETQCAAVIFAAIASSDGNRFPLLLEMLGSAHSIAACRKLALPCQRMGDDGFEFVEPRLPA